VIAVAGCSWVGRLATRRGTVIAILAGFVAIRATGAAGTVIMRLGELSSLAVPSLNHLTAAENTAELADGCTSCTGGATSGRRSTTSEATGCRAERPAGPSPDQIMNSVRLRW
jgi:hypothetical protein